MEDLERDLQQDEFEAELVSIAFKLAIIVLLIRFFFELYLISPKISESNVQGISSLFLIEIYQAFLRLFPQHSFGHSQEFNSIMKLREATVREASTGDVMTPSLIGPNSGGRLCLLAGKFQNLGKGRGNETDLRRSQFGEVSSFTEYV